MEKVKKDVFIICPRCKGLGAEHGCIGEGLCSLCLGAKKIKKEKENGRV